MALASEGAPGVPAGRLLRSGEMAARLGCSVRSLHRWIKSKTIQKGVFRSRKGGYLRFDAAAVFEELRK